MLLFYFLDCLFAVQLVGRDWVIFTLWFIFHFQQHSKGLQDHLLFCYLSPLLIQCKVKNGIYAE